MDIESKIDELLEKPAFLVDIFPCTVPAKPDNRYFAVEKYFQKSREELGRKFLFILLKLLCYYDLALVSDDDVYENPEPDQLAALIQACFGPRPAEEAMPGDHINILLAEKNAMIALDRDDQSMVVYGADDSLKEMIGSLARAEGLFFYKAPDFPADPAEDDVR
ncbi:MAG: hypothetical protein II627_09610 [Lachnospiraceae bacterium]|nr:hypothetical protein [Lachnospiraceae bacterium]